MNTFNYFIIGILLLSTQALAIRPIATKLERISVDTFRLTMDQPVQGWEDFLQETTDPYLKYRIFHGETNYLGNKDDNTTYVTKYITPINPNDRFTTQWEWKETAVLVAMDNDNLEEGTADMVYGLANSANEDPGETSLTFSLTEYLPLLAITTDNLTVNEKTQTVATLISNQNGATFSLDGSSDNNDLFKIENNVLKFKDANGVDYDPSLEVYTIHIKVRKSGKADAKKTLTVTINNVFEKDITIGNQARSVNENSVINTGIGDPLVTSGTIETFAITAGNDDGFFKINNTGHIQVAKVGLNFETKESHTFTVQITGDDAEDKTAQITININNIKENFLFLANQNRSIAENSAINTNVGTVLATIGTPTNYSITAGNDDGFFKINNTGQIQVAKVGLDFEGTHSYTLTVKITGNDAEDKTAQITIAINDVNDIAPTNIALSNNNITVNASIDTTIGILSATDVDTDDNSLTYSVNDTTNFKITGNQLKIKKVFTATGTFPITITASDNIHTPTQDFTITITSNPHPAVITNDANTHVDENITSTALTITATNEPDTQTLTYSISGADANLFNVVGSTGVITFKVAPDYEHPADNGADNIYNLTLEVNDGISTSSKTIIITVDNIIEQTIAIANQSRNIAEGSAINTNVGAILEATDATTFAIINGNDDGFFKINNTGQIQVAKVGLDFEGTHSYTLTVKITGNDAEDKTAQITIAINDVNDIAPTNIALSNNNITVNASIDTTIGILSATDVDTDDNSLTYSVNDTTNFKITGNQLKIKKVFTATGTFPITITASDNIHTPTQDFTITITSNPHPAVITNDANTHVDENITSTALTITATNEPDTQTLTYSISGADANLFNVVGSTGVITFKVAPDYEHPADNGADNIYNLTLEVNDGISPTNKTIIITVDNVIEQTIAIANQSRNIAEGSAINTNVGAILEATDATTFAIIDDNGDGFFTISNAGQIQVAKVGLDFESEKSHTLTVKITGDDAEDKTAQITITVTDIDDTAPTNITLSNRDIASNAVIDTIIGTLSATDVDTNNNDLVYSVNNTTDFEITGNQLKIKTDVTTITFPINITITASDAALSSTQDFTITKTIVKTDTVPVISQFIITQGDNLGRIINKNGVEVTVHALVSADSYEWSSSDTSNTSNTTFFTFNPNSITVDILTIKLKATTGIHSSERVLKLQLITESVSNDDNDSDGIPNNKDNNTAINKIQAGEGKTITSLAGTRILLGAMGKDSGRLTLAQMKEYIELDSNFTDKTEDTLTTGDIYHYVVEGLSAAGTATEVIIELTTAIPKDAVLRRYSLVTGWGNFVISNDNIKSKTSTDNTCTNDGIWEIGLTTGATCLKLTIKDGGANDTDGAQSDNTGDVNGVIENTISIAVPASTPIDPKDPADPSGSSGGGGGGGCVYNPNAPARFDMGFILLMVLSAYYLIRRKRRFV
jgi:2C-methyl-D-erythritol 2,4-cyclodiphosphate synthase